MKRPSDLSVFLWLSLATLAALLLGSPDSPLFDIFAHGDTAWFFTCGKAWMNGLVPYVDFSDSKGPLLWLIYGLGYLITPCGTLGMLLVSWLFYAVTLYVWFLTATLFLKDRRQAVLSSVLLLFPLFSPLLSGEIRCESFAQPFLALSLFVVCRLAYGRRAGAAVSGLVLGLCFGLLALMKYNIAAMQAGCLLAAFVLTWRERRHPWLLAAGGVGGCLLAWLPFAVYFLWQGNGRAFLSEYVLNTLQTVSNVGVMEQTALYILKPGPVSMLLVGLAATLLVATILRRWRWLPFWLFVWSYGWASLFARQYYFLPTVMFALFGTVWLMDRTQPHLASRRAAVLTALVLFTLFAAMKLTSKLVRKETSNLFFQTNEVKTSFHKLLYVMHQVDRPLVLECCGWNAAELPTHAMPACRYWSLQFGYTPDMASVWRDCLKRRVPDFVLVSGDTPEVAWMKDAGYFEYDFRSGQFDVLLYSKRKLNAPPRDYQVSNLDVIMRRR